MRSSTSRPGSSSPRRLTHPAETPRRERAMARLDSAPPILSSRLEACRSRPGLAGTPRTIVSPAVTTLGMPLQHGQVRPDARREFMAELRVRAELRVGAPGQLPEVGGPVLEALAHHAVDALGELEGEVEEVEGGLSLHGRVVGCEEVFRAQRLEFADGVLVPGGVEVARWDQAVPLAVVDAGLERGVYDDRRPVLRVPDPKVPRGVAGEVQDLDAPIRPEPHRLAAAQPGVYRGVAAELGQDPILRLLVRAEAVGLGPAVDLREHDLVVLHVSPVELTAREPQRRMPLLESAVAAAVVHVGVADDDLVDVLQRKPDLPQVRDYELRRRPGEDGDHQDRVILPDEEVLTHEASPQVRLDAVDARQDL